MTYREAMLPKSPATYQTERIGISAVAGALANLGLIWRETTTGDVGIDGQVEYVDDDGRATGRIVSLQVKSGQSYLTRQDGSDYLFAPNERHRHYWEQHPLPVVLVLHDPATGLSYWADVRQQLRGESRSPVLRVSQTRTLQSATRHDLFASVGVDGSVFVDDLLEVVRMMVARRSASADFPVSHFDLFVHGLTNIARSLYFGMDLALTIAEFNLGEAESGFGVGVGEAEHQFLFDFVKFLVAQNLARVEFADCLTDWDDREMQPHFVVPLTSRGRNLVSLIHTIEEEYVVAGVLPGGEGRRVAQEGFFEMSLVSFLPRMPRIRAFQQLWSSRQGELGGEL